MRIDRREGTTQRRIVTALIVDRTVLARIAPRWTAKGLFSSKWSNIVARWCVDYFQRYGKAPGKNIEGLFQSWMEKNQDKETVRIVEDFLVELSGEYQRLQKASNSEYLIDLAGQHFNEVKARNAVTTAKGFLDAGEVDKALDTLQSTRQIDIGGTAGIDVFNSSEILFSAFEARQEPLIQLPQGLGSFFGDTLERDGFLSIWGIEKNGKSRMALYLGMQAALQRRRVAYFQVGDMPQDHVVRRLASLVSSTPLRSGRIEVPVSASLTGGEFVVKKEPRDFEALNQHQALRAFQKLVNEGIKSKEPYFKLACYGNGGINVQGIASVLQSWDQQDGWTPDCVICDHADNLAPPTGPNVYQYDRREQITETWSQLRALSLKYHCLLIVPTQADARAYNKETLDMSNFSDSKAKNAHVTASVGLNMESQERASQVTRLNWVVRREDRADSRQCYCAGCWDFYNPAVVSVF